jgi:hypothetical protein
MANLFRRIYDWLLRLFWYAYLSSSTSSKAPAWVPDAPFDTLMCPVFVHEKAKSWAATTRDGCWLLAPCRATEMDITMIGLQNAGKTSLLRVLAVSPFLMRKDRAIPTIIPELSWRGAV